MADVISICNLAIEAVAGTPITALGGPGKESQWCGRHYDSYRDLVLEEKDWTFATKRTSLNTPVVLSDDDASLWGFAFAHNLPVDHIRVIEARDDVNWKNYSGLDWVVESGRILCDAELVYIRYIWRNEDPKTYTPAFVHALAARMAADLAIPLARNPQIAALKEKIKDDRIMSAGANDGRQGRTQQTRATRLTRVR